VFPLRNKDSNSVINVLNELLQQTDINSITEDGKRAFISNEVQSFCNRNGIKTYFVKADFLHHIRIVDSIIKILRDIFNGDIYKMLNNDEMKKAVYYLNNSINRNTKLTPTEIKGYHPLEDIWIRRSKEHNNIQLQKQNEK
jgi:hypothetical protein